MNLRHLSKYFIGKFFSKILIGRAEQVKKAFTLPESTSLSKTSVVNRTLRYYYACKLTPNNAEKAHKEFWENQKVDQWFGRTDDRLNELYIPTYQQYIEQVKSYLSEYEMLNICEWGVGNGSWLHYLSQQYPGLQKYTGVDLSHSQIEANKDKYSNLYFQQGDIVEWAKDNITPNTLYHTNSGVLEYLNQQSLCDVFGLVKAHANTGLFLIEPIAEHHDLVNQTDSFLHGNEYSCSHNLPHLIKQAGFDVILQEETTLLGFRILVIFAINV